MNSIKDFCARLYFWKIAILHAHWHAHINLYFIISVCNLECLLPVKRRNTTLLSTLKSAGATASLAISMWTTLLFLSFLSSNSWTLFWSPLKRLYFRIASSFNQRFWHEEKFLEVYFWTKYLSELNLPVRQMVTFNNDVEIILKYIWCQL